MESDVPQMKQMHMHVKNYQACSDSKELKPCYKIQFNHDQVQNAEKHSKIFKAGAKETKSMKMMLPDEFTDPLCCHG